MFDSAFVWVNETELNWVRLSERYLDRLSRTDMDPKVPCLSHTVSDIQFQDHSCPVHIYNGIAISTYE